MSLREDLRKKRAEYDADSLQDMKLKNTFQLLDKITQTLAQHAIAHSRADMHVHRNVLAMVIYLSQT